MTANIEKAKMRLSAMRTQLEALSTSSEEMRAPVELDQTSVGRLSRMDAMQQQAMAQATERKRATDLVRIEMAERRIVDDEYGFCEDCGDEIPDRRLEIDPMAERCVNCAG